jgi:hypothetical protein
MGLRRPRRWGAVAGRNGPLWPASSFPGTCDLVRSRLRRVRDRHRSLQRVIRFSSRLARRRCPPRSRETGSGSPASSASVTIAPRRVAGAVRPRRHRGGGPVGTCSARSSDRGLPGDARSSRAFDANCHLYLRRGHGPSSTSRAGGSVEAGLGPDPRGGRWWLAWRPTSLFPIDQQEEISPASWRGGPAGEDVGCRHQGHDSFLVDMDRFCPAIAGSCGRAEGAGATGMAARSGGHRGGWAAPARRPRMARRSSARCCPVWRLVRPRRWLLAGGLVLTRSTIGGPRAARLTGIPGRRHADQGGAGALLPSSARWWWRR